MGAAVIRAVSDDESAVVVSAVDGRVELEGQDAGRLAGLTESGVKVQSSALQAFSEADVVIDFTHPHATDGLVAACRDCGVPLVTGTTGFGPEEEAALTALAAEVGVVAAPNMSVGVNLLFALAERAAALAGPGFDAEIVEMHHRRKVDAPSGTAVRLSEVVARAKGLGSETIVHGRSGQVGARPEAEIGVMTLRGGDVVGEHTLVLAALGERLELTHRAHDRSIFARGAVRAAKWVLGQPSGRYGMRDVLNIDRT